MTERGLKVRASIPRVRWEKKSRSKVHGSPPTDLSTLDMEVETDMTLKKVHHANTRADKALLQAVGQERFGCTYAALLQWFQWRACGLKKGLDIIPCRIYGYHYLARYRCCFSELAQVSFYDLYNCSLLDLDFKLNSNNLWRCFWPASLLCWP